MSFLDALIPGALGLVLVLWPRSVFVGSKVTPDAAKIRLMRRLGILLLVIAAVFLVLSFVERP